MLSRWGWAGAMRWGLKVRGVPSRGSRAVPKSRFPCFSLPFDAFYFPFLLFSFSFLSFSLFFFFFTFFFFLNFSFRTCLRAGKRCAAFEAVRHTGLLAAGARWPPAARPTVSWVFEPRGASPQATRAAEGPSRGRLQPHPHFSWHLIFTAAVKLLSDGLPLGH